MCYKIFDLALSPLHMIKLLLFSLCDISFLGIVQNETQAPQTCHLFEGHPGRDSQLGCSQTCIPLPGEIEKGGGHLYKCQNAKHSDALTRGFCMLPRWRSLEPVFYKWMFSPPQNRLMPPSLSMWLDSSAFFQGRWVAIIFKSPT